MLNEEYYRERILSEHWQEFVELLSNATPPNISVSEAAYDRLQHYALEAIRSKYPELYADDEDEFEY